MTPPKLWERVLRAPMRESLRTRRVAPNTMMDVGADSEANQTRERRKLRQDRRLLELRSVMPPALPFCRNGPTL